MAARAADVAVRVDMADGVDSLNVATAAAIALHRLGGNVRGSREGGA
jgi:tRNA G18 (ribose-2'-O)-methylase SpoU